METHKMALDWVREELIKFLSYEDNVNSFSVKGFNVKQGSDNMNALISIDSFLSGEVKVIINIMSVDGVTNIYQYLIREYLELPEDVIQDALKDSLSCKNRYIIDYIDEELSDYLGDEDYKVEYTEYETITELLEIL